MLCGYYLQDHYDRRRYATRCIALTTDVIVVMWSVVLFRIHNCVVLPGGWHNIPHHYPYLRRSIYQAEFSPEVS